MTADRQRELLVWSLMTLLVSAVNLCPFELIVDPAPVIITPPPDINRCDENRVGFLDFDLIADQTPEILSRLDPSLNTADFEVFVF